MDPVIPSQSLPAALPGAPPQAQPDAARDALVNSDFETFLKMLTTQLQNQDPLNPMESTEFAVQLATFSGVEQQVRSNDLLQRLGTQLGALGMAQLSGWLGMEARAPGPVPFDGNPVRLTPEVPETADRAELVARNALGTEVHRQPLDLPVGPVDWAGFDASGRLLPAGEYTFEVQGFRGDAPLTPKPVETFARVTEARVQEGRTILMLETGAEVAAEDIGGLRAAPGNVPAR